MGNNKIEMLERKNRHTPEEIKRFIDTVFHDGVVEGANILFWRLANGKSPGYPFDETAAFDLMATERKPYAWYYGTASAIGPDKQGRLYNRQDTFSELHVIILDDIGSKIDPATLPPEFQTPSYIIESSPGNFQYGLVLDKPVSDLSHAKALVQAVYTSGFTDAGGKMPNKLVRLPFGIHGKKGDTLGFQVALRHLSDRQYSPDEIITLCNPGYTWSQVLENPAVADITLSRRSVGASPWHKDCTTLTTDGSTDMVAEYFIRNNRVISWTDIWLTVQCPWHREHTTGDDTAGYSPLGYGEGKYRNRRGFKCFHEHCKDRTAEDLINQLVYEEALPFTLPVFDPVWRWKAEWVFDKQTQEAVNIFTGERAHRSNFRFNLSEKTDGKSGKFKADLYLAAPDKITVMGTRYTPPRPAPLFHDSEGRLWLNKFQTPGWGDGAFDQRYVDTFLKHLEILCPIPAEREYFLNWITCKVNNPAFRGAGIIMTTPEYGTGRDTLGRMLKLLLGADNITNVRSEDLLFGTWNDFLENQLVICNELTDGDRRTGYYKAFEKLKELIDPQSKKTRLNCKYVRQYDAEIFASFLLFSNHEDPLPVGENDRRLYVITNTTIRQPAEYFDRVHTELDTVEDWGRHIFRYLRSRTPDYSLGNRPAPETHGKKVMIKTSKSPDQVYLECILDVIGSDIVVASAVTDFILACDQIRQLFAEGVLPAQKLKALHKTLRKITTPAHDSSGRIHVGRKHHRFRLRSGHSSPWFQTAITELSESEVARGDKARAFYRSRLELLQRLDAELIADILQRVEDRLNQ